MQKRRAKEAPRVVAPVPDESARLERLLRDRAATLAGRELEERAPAIFGSFVVARRLSSSIGFPMDHVREVRRVRTNRLPRAKRGIAGLFQLRGMLHVLVDMKPIVGDSPPLAHGESVTAVVVEHEGRCLGVRVDEVLGARIVLERELDRTHGERVLDLVAEITRDCVELLDVPALFRNPEFQMSQKT